jgi:hypothetical protein
VIETDAIICIAEFCASGSGEGGWEVMGIGDLSGIDRALAGASIAKFGERRALVKSDVLGLAAFDFVLRCFRSRMVCVAVDLEIACVYTNDRAADAPGFRIPAHVIADFESIRHEDPTKANRGSAEPRRRFAPGWRDRTAMIHHSTVALEFGSNESLPDGRALF